MRVVAVLAFGIGLAAGLSFYERWLPDLLRVEAGDALSRRLGSPVRIERVRPTLAGGLALRAQGVAAFDGEAGPALRIAEVVATLDLRALLRRQVTAARIETRGAHLEIARDAQGRWSPGLFASLDSTALAAGANGTVPSPAFDRGAISVDLVATVLRVTDHADPAAAPATIEAQLSTGRLVFDDGLREFSFGGWLARDGRPLGELDARLTRLDPTEAAAALGAIAGEREQEPEWRNRKAAASAKGPFELVVATRDLEVGGISSLALARVPLQASGRLTALFDLAVDDLATPAAGGRVSFDVIANDLRVPLSVGPANGRPPLSFDDGTTLRGALLFDAGHAAFDLALHSPREALTVSGTLARPATGEAELWLAGWLDRSDLDRVREVARALPGRAGSRALDELASLQAATLRSVEASAAGPLARWKALLGGEPGAWLRGFRAPPVVALRLDEVALAAGSTRLEHGEGWVDWRGDALVLRALGAVIDGRAQPLLDLDLDGVAALLAAARGAPAIPRIGPLPGVAVISRLLDDEPGTENDPPRWRELRIEIDRMAHELLLWPLTDARLAIRPRDDRGVHLVLEHARWGGADLVASGDFVPGERDRVMARATVRAPQGAPPREAKTDDWGIARFELDLSASNALPVSRIEGLARAQSQTVRLFETAVSLRPSGRALGAVTFDLSSAEHLPFEANVRSEALGLSVLASLFGGHAASFTGNVSAADVRLAGRLRPHTSPFDGARGDARLVARNGEVLTDLPVLLYLASASGGLNPFASTDRIRYRKISGAFTLADGRVTTETFVLNGPDMRIALNGGVGVLEPYPAEGVAALFFKGNISRTIGKIPLVRDIVLGSDRAFVSLWFQVDGPWRDPRVRLIPTRTLNTGPTNLIFDGLPAFVRGGAEAIGRVAQRWRDDSPPPASESEQP